MDLWIDLLKEVPYVAMVVALGLSTILLYRSREKDRKEREVLQSEYRENLVQSTGALQELTAEYLKQAFADSSAWQDRFKGLEDGLKTHITEDASAHLRLETKQTAVLEEIEKHEIRVREFVKDHVGEIAKRTVDRIEALERSMQRDHRHDRG